MLHLGIPIPLLPGRQADDDTASPSAGPQAARRNRQLPDEQGRGSIQKNTKILLKLLLTDQEPDEIST